MILQTHFTGPFPDGLMNKNGHSQCSLVLCHQHDLMKLTAHMLSLQHRKYYMKYYGISYVVYNERDTVKPESLPIMITHWNCTVHEKPINHSLTPGDLHKRNN